MAATAAQGLTSPLPPPFPLSPCFLSLFPAGEAHAPTRLVAAAVGIGAWRGTRDPPELGPWGRYGVMGAAANQRSALGWGCLKGPIWLRGGTFPARLCLGERQRLALGATLP